ncbi:dimethylmenaquinone methyltransferase [Acuticoccus sediminis]|uniref:Putative 4-hydroxy-4-methyl-2-oxoglutarate aldolase n=1 Tax=Acuticoccus sediminis TaxID=2184697 RepID=A0A8B2P2B2_9HYPH|nr:4-carboxy-4-hydroxy-2-oxoadipate aldolase/oxaloacetate decarboxylase [Acuticoccus sediminis]RAI02417.1 dimethylmenaquinone methyltransferase [Acuticoccus sediminis]
MKPIVYTKIPRIDRDLIARAARQTVADLHEGLGAVAGRQCLLGPKMRPVWNGAKVCGQAVTCFNYPGDNLMLHAALRLAEPGDVVVATNGGEVQGALWGDMATLFAQLKGLGGAVIDGSARDSASVAEMGFPVFASVISVSHPEKRGPGSANVPVVVCGITVHPGDLIVGDADGVLAIPPELVETAVAGAEARSAKEEAMRARLKEGATMFDLLNLQPLFEAAGIVEVEGAWNDPR